MIINTDAGYMDLGYRAGWSQNDGDRTDSVTWDYGQQLSRIDFSKVTYLELMVVVNANSADYTGWVWFYLDNMKFSGGGIVLNPKPATGAKDVDVNTQLSWSAGAHATSHNLYLGTSQAAVNGANGASDPSVTFVQLDGTSFDPNSLKFNTQYFWRVDAVNDVNPDSPWKGAVWDFTTANFIIVDDFESYTDPEGNRIYETWVDGFDDSDHQRRPGRQFQCPVRRAHHRAHRPPVHAADLRQHEGQDVRGRPHVDRAPGLDAQWLQYDEVLRLWRGEQRRRQLLHHARGQRRRMPRRAPSRWS